MAISLVQSKTGTSSTATTSIAFDTAPTSGNLIVLRFAADDYNGTPDTGWTQSTGMEQQTFHGGYLWWRLSTGTNSFQYTIGSASGSAWILEEWSGLDSTSPYDISNGSFTQASGTTKATPNITPTAGDRLLLVMFGCSTGSSMVGGTATYTNSFTASNAIGDDIGSTRDWCGAAYRTVTADGATAYGTTGTYINGAQSFQSSSGLIISFKAAASSGSTVTGAGSAAGTGTATGVGASTFRAVGASSGTGAASGVGASTFKAAAASVGSATASATGKSTAAGTGSSSGAATVSGASTSQSTLTGAGSSSGAATVSGVGASFARAVGSSSGAASTSFVGKSIFSGTASSVGSSTTTATGQSTAAATGSASGTGFASARSAGATTDIFSVGGDEVVEIILLEDIYSGDVSVVVRT